MKQFLSVTVILALLIAIFGVLNLVLWFVFGRQIYALVFGVFFLILAWFVFHFRTKN